MKPQVARLAVSGDQAAEQAEDAHDVEGADLAVLAEEGVTVEIGAAAEIAGEHRGLEFWGDVAAGVVQQHRQIPGGMSAHGILEIEQPTRARPSRSGSQIRFSAW